MVNIYWLLLFVFSTSVLGAEIRVQAQTDQVEHFESLPVPVTIMITHPGNEQIDETSFLLGKQPIKVEKIKDVGDASRDADILTIYHYDLTDKPKGLHMLPAISVKIGHKSYKSIASTFEVKGAEGVNDNATNVSSTPASVSSGGAFLKLENIIQGPTTLYPGQTTIVGYRYSYNADIETTEEITPLFDPKGFVKVGDKIVNNKNTEDTSILEVTQQIQADAPGVYQIGPSSVEGSMYTEESGKRVYSKNKLKGVAPAVTLTVKPIPDDNKPASFNGAIGKYTFKVTLNSSPTVTVGDEMTLRVDIGGSGDLDNVQLPELCCQPGMSGVFKLSDLPPVGKIEGSTKKFTVNLRPLTSSVKSIPSFEFSFFNPDTQKFETLHSSPIQISVSDLKVPSSENEAEKPAAPSSASKQDSSGSWQQKIKQPPPIEVESVYKLEPSDVENRWAGTWWMLLIIPFGIGLLIYQKNLKQVVEKQPEIQPETNSLSVYRQAWEQEPNSSTFYAQLYDAFFLRLQERRDIDDSITSIDKLPSEGAAGDVKALLTALEEARYAGDKGEKTKLLLEQARQLFKELEAH